MTPASLAAVLHGLGYDVTLRCLTDWRAKGLLPPLHRESRGYRKGVLRYWSQADILKRALAVCRQFRGSRRANQVLVKTWGCGTNHDLRHVRRALLSEASRRAGIGREIVRVLASAIGRWLHVSSSAVSDVLLELSDLMFVRNRPVGKHFDVEYLVQFVNRIARRIFQNGQLYFADAKSLTVFLEAMRATITPVGFYDLINSASDSELAAARDKWHGWWSRIDALVCSVTGNPADNDEMSSVMKLAAAFAPIGIVLLLPVKSPAAIAYFG